MKFLGYLLPLFLAAIPCAVIAKEIPIRAGEHDEFTRFVVRIPQGRKWSVDSEPGRVNVDFEGYTSGFSMARVFSRIPKTRVTDIRVDQGSFTLLTNCDCPVEFFVAEGRFLAIDIQNGPSLTQVTSPSVPANLPVSGFQFGDLLWGGNPSTLAEGSASVEVESSGEEAERFFRESQDQLREGVMNATARGILTPYKPFSEPIPEEMIEAPSSPEVSDPSKEDGSEFQSAITNLRVSNNSDFPVGNAGDNDFPDNPICGTAYDLQVEHWGIAERETANIGRLRSELFDELDSFDASIGEELAKAYLYFGFGPEAKQILGLSKELLRANPELSDISDIMEYGYARNPRVLHSGLGCPSAVALWSVLSAKSIPKSQFVDTDAVLRSLNTLPVHLRELLAPKAAKRLLEYGASEAADAAMRTIDRTPRPVTDEAKLTRAAIELTSGAAHAGVRELKEMIQNGSALSPNALIEIVNEAVSEGKPLGADIALLAESYAFELKKGDLGEALMRANVIASAKSGQFSRAFELMSDDRMQSQNRKEIADIQAVILRELAERGSDIVFAKTMYSYLPSATIGVDRDAVLMVAARALDIGFPKMSREILDLRPSLMGTREAQFLEARIALAAGEPNGALEAIAGFEGDDSDLVRAIANERLGENEAAHEGYDSIGDSESALRTAWLSSSWLESVSETDPVFGKSVSVSRAPLERVRLQRGMLRSLSGLVEESESARQSLSSLLSSTGTFN